MAGYIMAVENHTDVYFEHRSLEQITGDLSELLMRRHLHLTTAESCTGGKLASALCAAENTPEWFGIGFVTFNDDAKAHILGVSRETLAEHTAVSEAVAREMAEGARQRAEQDIAISITGYGGPDDGEDGTPAGTVWFGWSFDDRTETAVKRFGGECEEVLDQAVTFALGELLDKLMS